MKLDRESVGGKIKDFFDDTVNQIARRTKFVQRKSALNGLSFCRHWSLALSRTHEPV